MKCSRQAKWSSCIALIAAVAVLLIYHLDLLGIGTSEVGDGVTSIALSKIQATEGQTKMVKLIKSEGKQSTSPPESIVVQREPLHQWVRNPLSCALEEGSWDFVDAPTQPQEAARHNGAAGLAQLTPSPLEDIAKTNKVPRWRPNPYLPPGCTFHRFTQPEALRCLQGKFILFYGNSNTRTLYTAMESLLKNQPQVSRLAAKQQCDNSKHNHSCWMVIGPSGSPQPARDEGGGHGAELLSDSEILSNHLPIRLYYWGYIKDVYDPSLDTKMINQLGADAVITNSQLNIVQAVPSDAELVEGHRKGMSQFNRFAAKFARARIPPAAAAAASGTKDKASSDVPAFFWHTTTYVCPNQPHFKRYRYQKKFWAGRTPHQTNTAIHRSNTYIVDHVDKSKISILDGAKMVEAIYRNGSVGEQLLCPYYDDPLHHRFLDTEIIQLFLNRYCPIPV